MGAVCCCLRVEDIEEHANSNALVHRHCICLRCLTQQFIHAYTLLFQRGQVHPVPSSVQRTAPSDTASPVTDASISDTYRSPPRPLPFDDPRFSQLHHDRFVSRHDKSSSGFHEESEPLRSSINDNDAESVNTEDKSKSKYEGGCKLSCSESSLKHPSTLVTSGVMYVLPSCEDEDVCPTCLEEYTPENPRITMQCSHHFHLSCIYEWMERSNACPVCGKVMVFNETK